MKKEEWCDCGDEEMGFYYDGRGDDNECECQKNVPHVHCQNCGGILQVS